MPAQNDRSISSEKPTAERDGMLLLRGTQEDPDAIPNMPVLLTRDVAALSYALPLDADGSWKPCVNRSVLPSGSST